MHNRTREEIVKYLETIYDLNPAIFTRRFSEGPDFSGRLFFNNCRVNHVEFIADEKIAQAKLDKDAQEKKVLAENASWHFANLTAEERKRIQQPFRVHQKMQAAIESVFENDDLRHIFFTLLKEIEITLDEKTVISIKHKFYRAIFRIIGESPEWQAFWNNKLKKSLAADDQNGELIIDKISALIIFRLLSSMEKHLVTIDQDTRDKYAIITKIIYNEGSPKTVVDELGKKFIDMTITTPLASDLMIKFLTCTNKDREKEISKLNELISMIPITIGHSCELFQFKALGVYGRITMNRRLEALLSEILTCGVEDRDLLLTTLANVSRQIFITLKHQYHNVELRGELLDSTSQLCDLAVKYCFADLSNQFKKAGDEKLVDEKSSNDKIIDFAKTVGKLLRDMQLLGERNTILLILNRRLSEFVNDCSQLKREVSSKIAKKTLKYLQKHCMDKKLSLDVIQSARQLCIETFKFANEEVRSNYKDLETFLIQQMMLKRNDAPVLSPRAASSPRVTASSPRAASSPLTASSSSPRAAVSLQAAGSGDGTVEKKKDEMEKEPEKNKVLLTRSTSSGKLKKIFFMRPGTNSDKNSQSCSPRLSTDTSVAGFDSTVPVPSPTPGSGVSIQSSSREEAGTGSTPTFKRRLSQLIAKGNHVSPHKTDSLGDGKPSASPSSTAQKPSPRVNGVERKSNEEKRLPRTLSLNSLTAISKGSLNRKAANVIVSARTESRDNTRAQSPSANRPSVEGVLLPGRGLIVPHHQAGVVRLRHNDGAERIVPPLFSLFGETPPPVESPTGSSSPTTAAKATNDQTKEIKKL